MALQQFYNSWIKRFKEIKLKQSRKDTGKAEIL